MSDYKSTNQQIVDLAGAIALHNAVRKQRLEEGPTANPHDATTHYEGKPCQTCTENGTLLAGNNSSSEDGKTVLNREVFSAGISKTDHVVQKTDDA